MTETVNQELLAEVGRQAAHAAGQVLCRNFEKPHDITMKSVIDPVTESDLASQEAIIRVIRQAFPDHEILAEEVMNTKASETRTCGPAGPAPRYRWIVDPLDGTVNFAHGFPVFSVSIAFEAKGLITYGVVYDPLRKELFEARRGGGAFLNGRPLRVSQVRRLEEALLATGFPYDIRERLPQTLARLGRMLGAAQGVRRAGSAALDLAYVAAGRLDGFWEENLKPWDTAAGMLLVMESGGRLSCFDGSPYTLMSPTIIASNGLLHEALLEKFRESGPPLA